MLNDGDVKDVLLALLVEHGAAMREKSQPEYVFTAAAVAGFGAVCWGVAALPAMSYSQRLWTHPALIAAFGVFLGAFFIIVKIAREHVVYQRIRASRAATAETLKNLLGDKGAIVPHEYLKKESGGGVRYSFAVVGAAAAGSIAFCLSIFF